MEMLHVLRTSILFQEYDARAALAAEKAAEKEEEKRRQKIAEWEDLNSMGMGAGRATGTSTSTPAPASTSGSRQRSSFRPGKRRRESQLPWTRQPCFSSFIVKCKLVKYL